MGTIGLKGENRTEFFNFLQCYSMGFYCDVSKDLNDLLISPNKPNKPNYFIPTNYTLYTEKILDKEYRIFPQCQFKIHSLSVLRLNHLIYYVLTFRLLTTCDF